MPFELNLQKNQYKNHKQIQNWQSYQSNYQEKNIKQRKETFLYKKKIQIKMSNCLRQSQLVETSMEQEEFPPLENVNVKKETVISDNKNDENDELIVKQAIGRIVEAETEEKFSELIKELNGLFAKGYSSLITQQAQLHKRMMSHFVQLSKRLQSSSHAQSEMLFILSLIAEMIKESPTFYFPFTRKFLLTVFEIDNQSLEHSPFKNQILAILSVIYHNLSLQGRLVKKLNVEKDLKLALMTNYSLINQLFTLKLFNRSVLNLATKGLTFTAAEFSKYGILQTISKFIAKNQVEVFLARMKTCMFQVKPKLEQAKKLVA